LLSIVTEIKEFIRHNAENRSYLWKIKLFIKQEFNNASFTRYWCYHIVWVHARTTTKTLTQVVGQYDFVRTYLFVVGICLFWVLINLFYISKGRLSGINSVNKTPTRKWLFYYFHGNYFILFLLSWTKVGYRGWDATVLSCFAKIDFLFYFYA
jgi:hypothetical protein